MAENDRQHGEQPAPGRPDAGAARSVGGSDSSFSGQVQQVGPPLTVETNGQGRQVATEATVVVTRDGQPASVPDIEQGDEVTVTTGPSGAATRIDATSAIGGLGRLKQSLPQLLPTVKRFGPILVAPVLLGGLLWFLAKRRRTKA